MGKSLSKHKKKTDAEVTGIKVDGGRGVEIKARKNATIEVSAGENFSGTMHGIFDKNGDKNKLEIEENAALKVGIREKGKSGAKNHKDLGRTRAKEETKKTSPTKQNDIKTDEVMHLNIKISDKRETERMGFKPSQKVSALRNSIEKKYPDLKFVIYGKNDKKLVEDETFLQNKIQQNDWLILTTEVLASSNNSIGQRVAD